MDARPNSPEARDIRYHLHGYTNARKHQETGPLVIEKGDGIYVEDIAGNRYIEAMAGLWSVAVGFSEKRLVEAATRQMSKLPFYHDFGSKAHSPLIDLAEKLVQMAPVPMSKAYFTNSGSEANDTAIKMIWYRSNALGQPARKKIISRKRGYHGVTIASASLTGLPNNHLSFDLPIANILHTSTPHHWRDAEPGESEEQFSARLADDLDKLILAEGPETIAAFIGEPIMGAGGVVVPPAGYWEKIQAVFEPIADESDRIGTFGHGFTGGGHPVAAAVALENIKLIEERDLVDNARKVGAHLQARLRKLASHPLVGEVRGVGLIAAVELVADKATKAPWGKPAALGALVNGFLQQNGVISRNMGDAIAFCPPLIITETQVDALVDAFERSLAAALPQVRAQG